MAIGERLREERKRLKMTQSGFAEAGGIGVSTLKLYEANERDPGALFLNATSTSGVDVQYVVTGVRSNSALSGDEQMLLDGYRSLDGATKRRALAFMLTESGPVAIQKKIKEATAKTVKARGKHAQVSEADVSGDNNVVTVGNKSP